jgi:catechol 2,3-dioxygenase-like lactoylglutathione lyase family enzyme
MTVDQLAPSLHLTTPDQVGFVVRDMDTALALYEPLFGPFNIMDTGPMDYTYRGQQESCHLLLAFGSSGELEIELIQWISGGSPHKEFIDSGREGMQHLRYIVDDLDSKVAELAAAGYESIWGTRFGEGLAVAYLERADDPLIIELFENHGMVS